MQRPRIIPILSLSENRLINTIKFKNPRYIGDPINAIRIFNEKLVDEIIILDISASRKNINPNYQLIENMASECFMPISYGGGIKSFEQAKKVFDLGVEKVVLNSCCYLNMKLVEQIASHYGSQSVVVSMDYRKDFWGNILFISHGLRKKHRLNFMDHIFELEQYGMGELILTSIENDGCFSGFNKFLFPYVEKINVPVIINGGLSSFEDINHAFDNFLSGVAGTSFFVYQKNNTNSILINYPDPNSIKNLRNNERM